ncbi:MAG: L-serine ammonia-lyase [Psychrobium sp.]|nr:L-serine ammonia-lyase [Psychrobium sp.]
MAHSIFDLFKVGIGPSSSHTVGPMIAANRFLSDLSQQDVMTKVSRIKVDLYGSLALTGKGHATDNACILGLMGETPSTIEAENIEQYLNLVSKSGELALDGKYWIKFDAKNDLVFNFYDSLPQHPNGMTIHAYDEQQELLFSKSYFSIGGGFVVAEDEFDLSHDSAIELPYAYVSARELLALCEQHDLSISEIMFANEKALGTENISEKIDHLWQVMSACIERGIKQQGVLPGSIKLKRRAYDMNKRIKSLPPEHVDTLDWINLFAMAVNEENAAGGRVVTAPTNGAAGVLPAVLAWFLKCRSTDDKKAIEVYLSTAAAIGLLYHRNASISAAEVGCQGEIGVACSIAAAGLAAAMGGTPAQIENAAEIGMEHNLGLTCDPIDGLVQVPCIERNTMGAIKAINACKLALQFDGDHVVHLDEVIATMHQTGLDMMSKYKETSQGGLAINVIAC